jgi:hypothetical protein
MSIIPNSFSTPNDYIDASMEFLTSEEFKCLMFATRHLLGWQGGLKGQPKAMSLSMFEHGYTAANGTVYGGTGLSRGAIVRALAGLADFGLLVKAGDKATPDGQEWQLGEAPDFEAMAARKEAQRAKAAERTAKAREAKANAGQSDKPVTASQSDRPAAVSRTDRQRSVGQTQLNPSLKPTQIQDDDDDAGAREGGNIFALYHTTFGQLVSNPILADDLKDMQAEYPAQDIADAFRAAALANARSIKYVRSCLENWRINGRDKPKPVDRPATPKGTGPLPRSNAPKPNPRVSPLPPVIQTAAPSWAKRGAS